MYINLSLLQKSELSLEELLYLIAIKQKEEEFVVKYTAYHNIQENMLERGYIKFIKSGEKRIDKKGEKLLKDLSSSMEISDSVKTIADWMYTKFKDREGGIIKSKPELQRRLQWFSEQTGYSHNKLAVLISLFMQNTYSKESGLSLDEAKKDNPRLVFNNIAENMLWTPPNNFSRIYKLEESPLNRFYEDNQEYIEEVWKQNGIE